MLILLVSLAERKWGAGISGLLIGLPLTSGPVLFILAIERGPRFSAQTSIGTLLGLAAVAAFSLAYARVARSLGWFASFAIATACYVGLSAFLLRLPLRTGVRAFAVSCAAIVLTMLMLAPKVATRSGASIFSSREVVLRMLVAAVLVYTLTRIATVLGPGASGIVAMFPVYTSIMAIFNHMKSDALALSVLRGVVTGSCGAVGFFTVLIVALGSLPTVLCFLLAVAAAMGIEALLFPLLKRAPLEPQAG